MCHTTDCEVVAVCERTHVRTHTRAHTHSHTHTFIPLLIKHVVEIDILLNNRYSIKPLFTLQIVKLLLYANARVDAVDRVGNTPLHLVANVATARLLLDKGNI